MYRAFNLKGINFKAHIEAKLLNLYNQIHTDS